MNLPRILCLCNLLAIAVMPANLLLASDRVQVIDSELDESSGVTRSGRSANVFWTHNDSGGKPKLYAFDLSGKLLGTSRVTGAINRDWEDIGIGPGPRAGQPYLYIGDIGDNGRHRPGITIYRVLEPVDPTAGKKTAPAERLDFTYPDGAHDAEGIIVHPTSGDIYIFTKTRRNEKPAVYKAAAPHKAGESRALAKLRDLDLPDNDAVGAMLGRVTGAAVNPKGDRVVLCGYAMSYEAVLPKGAKFDEIFSQPWLPVSLGQRPQGEGVTYAADGLTLVATSEGMPMTVVITRRELK